MKTEIQVVCGAFVWNLGAVAHARPAANLPTMESLVPFFGNIKQ